ncbi:MAG: transglutaminase domain-containing protein [candidate division Zixibacteria bacterium]|nr:transglutaminase domain-containing protein [candidate division Zixibacteria bacterium]
MSRLHAHEKGHVLPTLCEELTHFRRARSIFRLSATPGTSILYVLARPHRSGDNPLRIAINGQELPPVAPGDAFWYLWHAVPLPGELLRPGDNTVECWCDATAMNGWSLGIENGKAWHSSVSDDGGQTWRRHGMGYLNNLNGEYVIRIRTAWGRDPSPPVMICEDSGHPRAEALRRLLPRSVVGARSRMDKVRALSSWISQQWEHTSSARAAQYAPWDAETILAWGRSQRGHAGQRPIVMCVHYAIAFVSACQSLEIPARCAVLIHTPNGTGGHFVAEVWFDEYHKWVMVDPNCDAIFQTGETPLSLREIRQLGCNLEPHVRWGQGYFFQRTFAHMKEWIRDNYLKGLCFRYRSLWPRSDFLSHPECSPPGHGAVSYCETDLVWERGDREAGFGMFRYFADPEYFDRSPHKK